MTPSHGPICSRTSAVSLLSEVAPDLWERSMESELEITALGRVTVVRAPRGFIGKLLQWSQIKATLYREDRHSLISWHRLSACPSLLALASHQPRCLGRDTVHTGSLQGLPFLIHMGKCQGHREVATWKVGLSGSELQLLHPLLH